MTDWAGMTDAELHDAAEQVAAELRRRARVRVCVECGDSFEGRPQARFCSGRCRVAHHRRGGLPAELTSRPRWVRRDARKVPRQLDGSPAKSNDPETWATFSDARASAVGVGLGFVVNGDGLACYDLDKCADSGRLSDAARDFLAALSPAPFWVEWSPSGRGVHAWGFWPSADRTRWTTGEGLSVELYTSGQYLSVTGERLSNDDY